MKFGHVPTIATSTKEGISKIQTNSDDLVITGWMNGDATGHGVIAAANAKNVPVIVISGSGFADAVQADEPRAALYFEKPVNPEALVNAVDELLRSRAWPRAEQLGKFSSPVKWRCYANNDFHRVFWAMKMFSEERFIVWFSVGLVLVCGIVIGYYRLARMVFLQRGSLPRSLTKRISGR